MSVHNGASGRVSTPGRGSPVLCPHPHPWFCLEVLANISGHGGLRGAYMWCGRSGAGQSLPSGERERSTWSVAPDGLAVSRLLRQLTHTDFKKSCCLLTSTWRYYIFLSFERYC